jgi:hypothetical protein
MSRITRDSFVEGAAGQGLDLRTLSDEAKTAVEKAGLSQTELQQIAGADGIINGKDELGQLFDFIDKADHNHSFKSIDTTETGKGGQTVASQSGALYEALNHELAKARLGAPAGEKPIAPKVENKNDRKISNDIANQTAPATAADRELAVSTLKNKGFTDIHLAANTPYFNQADRRWGGHDYPKTPPELDKSGNPTERTFKNAGCAPSALAMADVALRGSKATPLEVGKFAVDHKVSGKPGKSGSDTHGLGKAWAKEHALVYTPAQDASAKQNVDTLRDGLKAGGIGVIAVGVDPETKNGCAVDKDGKEWFFVVNPGRNDQKDGKVLKTDADVVQDRSLHHGAGQLMISRAQLEKEMKHAFVLSKPE